MTGSYVHEMSQPTKVLGEDLETLLQIIPYFKTTKTRAGTVNVSAERVPFEVVAPFLRALMRREARLLIEDADLVTENADEPRTTDQRRADAFVDVITSLSAASRYHYGSYLSDE